MNTKDFQPEIFKLFDDQWGILTAGDKDAFNSMTISWGNAGNTLVYASQGEECLRSICQSGALYVWFHGKERLLHCLVL